jgi:hypothetical protein
MRLALVFLLFAAGCAGLGRPGATFMGLDGGGPGGPVSVECKVTYLEGNAR